MSSALERARTLHEKIKSVLMQDWDPIGVKGIAEAQDEYDGLCTYSIRYVDCSQAHT
jgi:hypothetical protein